jgi:hypothetical protein
MKLQQQQQLQQQRRQSSRKTSTQSLTDSHLLRGKNVWVSASLDEDDSGGEDDDVEDLEDEEEYLNIVRSAATGRAADLDNDEEEEEDDDDDDCWYYRDEPVQPKGSPSIVLQVKSPSGKKSPSKELKIQPSKRWKRKRSPKRRLLTGSSCRSMSVKISSSKYILGGLGSDSSVGGKHRLAGVVEVEEDAVAAAASVLTLVSRSADISAGLIAESIDEGSNSSRSSSRSSTEDDGDCKGRRKATRIQVKSVFVEEDEKEREDNFWADLDPNEKSAPLSPLKQSFMGPSGGGSVSPMHGTIQQELPNILRQMSPTRLRFEKSTANAEDLELIGKLTFNDRISETSIPSAEKSQQPERLYEDVVLFDDDVD